MTLSCLCVDCEKQIVWRTKRCIRSRSVRGLRAFCCVWRLPGLCSSGARSRVIPHGSRSACHRTNPSSLQRPQPDVTTVLVPCSMACHNHRGFVSALHGHGRKLPRAHAVFWPRERWVPPLSISTFRTLPSPLTIQGTRRSAATSRFVRMVTSASYILLAIETPRRLD